MTSDSVFDTYNQNNDIDGKIIVSLERISQAFRVLLWSQSKELLLSPIQIQILIFLLFHSEEKRKVSYLADEFNLTKATISDSVKILYQKKLISKVSEKEDSRSYIISLTEEGWKIAQKSSLFVREFQFSLDKMDAEGKENLFRSLIEIIQHLNQSGIITVQRMCKTCVNYLPNYNGNIHFCKLLNQQLHDSELRVDCPEYILN